jgi:DNA polymerase-3 subunit delta
MKLPSARINSFLARPDPQVRAVLLYGSDAGLVRARADRLAQAVVPDAGDPFRISLIAGAELLADPPRLADEAAALCFGGGRRVVRVREAGDRLAEIFAGFLADPAGEALVVVEAGEDARKLRAAFEAARTGAAIACYADDGAALAGAVREAFQARGIKASDEAVATLAGLLGPDRQLMHAEVEKLALYAGADGQVTEDDVLALAADAGKTTLDDAIDAALAGDRRATDRALFRLAAGGAAPVAVVRGLARHLLRLHAVQARIAAGESPEGALRALRPPLFFKRQRAFQTQLQTWRGKRLADALDRVTQAELRCKETGQPDRLLAERVFLELAAAARAAG